MKKYIPIDKLSLSQLDHRRATNRKRYHRRKLEDGLLSQPRHADMWVAREFQKYGAIFTIILPDDNRHYTDSLDLKKQMKIVKKIIRNALPAESTKEQFAQAMREHAEEVWNRIGRLSVAQQAILWKRIKYK